MTVAVVVIAAAIFMIGVEVAVPGREWPKVARWWWRAFLLNGVQAGSVFLAAATWDRWLPSLSLWDAARLGTTGGAALGYLVITFVYYWWHRWRHEVGFLWRWFHQVHHSPQRIEVITSFYKHPLEIVVNGVLSSAILYVLLGLGPAAASQAVLLTGVAELFYHWNVKAPYWVGYIFQRPESHCVHHQEGLHSYNYSDLPLWDIIFGTFKNPKRFATPCGFGPERELRLGEMILGVDVYGTEAE